MEVAVVEASTAEAAVVSTAAAWVDFMVAVATQEGAVIMAEADTEADPTIAAAGIIVAEVTTVGAGVTATGGVEDMDGAEDIGATRVTVTDGAGD
jgi:hypothetical protein